MKNLIASYLLDLEAHLRSRGLFDADALAEVESHLLESVEVNRRRGLNQVEAEKEALRRFGSVKVVSLAFEQERINLMQKLLLGLALAAGLFIAYVDSRPTWDDTGITVGFILLSSGLLTLVGYRRPWLIALAIGAWLPVYEIYKSQDFSLPNLIFFPLFVLFLAFVGAYSGWMVNLGIRRMTHPA